MRTINLIEWALINEAEITGSNSLGRMIRATLPVLRWMRDREIPVGNLTIYTAEQWAERHEDTCNGADAVLTFDGHELYDVMNGSFGWELMESLYNVVSEAGYFLEQGYAWNAGIYREEV